MNKLAVLLVLILGISGIIASYYKGYDTGYAKGEIVGTTEGIVVGKLGRLSKEEMEDRTCKDALANNPYFAKMGLEDCKRNLNESMTRIYKEPQP